VDAIAVAAPGSPATAPFAGRAELSVDVLVREVLARNPTLTQMVAAWEAARARYPQVTSLDDPVLTAWAAPAAVGQLEDGNRGYRLEASQKYPWCGKLALRGDNALAEARAAGNEVEDTKLQLVEAARDAFFDYYLVHRALDLNRASLRLLGEFKGNAQQRYRTGKGAAQDILQADVETGRQRERGLLLERTRRVATARINTLMHLPPDAPLPPPPRELRVEGGLPEAAALRARALEFRPDLRALADRVAAEEASLALAQKEFYPDVELMGAYDSFWGLPDQRERAQVGVRVNLPVRLDRRRAAVAEARARVAGRRAELDRRTDEVNYEVEQAYRQVRESVDAERLYRETVVPKARANVEAAQADYVTGNIPFLTLIEAQRNVIGLQDRYHEIVADCFRRRAALDRAVGEPATPAPEGGPH
jgi:outer membrane protein TolC